MDSGTGDPVWRSDSPAPRIAVIAALELEAQILRTVLQDRCGPIYVSGPGHDRAEAAARQAIAGGAESLVAWGLAGGISPGVTTGTVILPARLIGRSREWRAESTWRRRLAAAMTAQFNVSEEPLFSAENVVTTPAAKAALAARTGAVAVDMESAGIAAAAADAGLPFVALRVIADGPDDTLPNDIETLVTADGRTRYRGVPSFLLSPRRFRLLIRLAGQSQSARRVLRQVALALGASEL
jgi:adenosylhomocysteine nucleosidase